MFLGFIFCVSLLCCCNYYIIQPHNLVCTAYYEYKRFVFLFVCSAINSLIFNLIIFCWIHDLRPHRNVSQFNNFLTFFLVVGKNGKDMRIRWKRSVCFHLDYFCVKLFVFKICSLFYVCFFFCVCMLSFIWFDFHSLNIDFCFSERLWLLLKEFVYWFWEYSF